MNRYLLRRRACQGLFVILLAVTEVTIAQSVAAGDPSQPSSAEAIRLAGGDELWAKVHVRTARSMHAKRRARGSADYRAAEEAAQLEARRDTQRRLDELVTQQLLDKAASRHHHD
jgi:hypothetical protein